MYYLGIDPGITGAWCLLSEFGIQVEDFGESLYESLVHSISAKAPIFVWIEKVWASPNQSPQAAFSFGQNYGYWKGILDVLGITYKEVTPYEWQSIYKLKFERKTYSEKKKELFQLCHKELEKNNISIKVKQKQADSILIALALKEYVSNRNQYEEQYFPGSQWSDCDYF